MEFGGDRIESSFDLSLYLSPSLGRDVIQI